MITIQDLINKIKWDKKENPKDYIFYYEDRVQKKLIKVPFTAIKKIEDSFMMLGKDGEETNVPLHRIKIVKKQGKIVWQRKPRK